MRPFQRVQMCDPPPPHVFSVLDVPTCALWIEADQGVTNDGGYASDLNDFSGFNRHCHQTSSGLRWQIVPNALNGHPVLRNDGSKYMTSGTLSGLGNETHYTVTHVFKYSTTDGCVLIGFNNTWYEFSLAGVGSLADIDAQCSDFYRFYGIPDNNPHIANVVYDGSLAGGWFALKLYIDGVLWNTRTNGYVQANAPNPCTQYVLGARVPNNLYPFHGDFAATTVHTGAVSDSDRLLINQHFGAKYGITITS